MCISPIESLRITGNSAGKKPTKIDSRIYPVPEEYVSYFELDYSLKVVDNHWRLTSITINQNYVNWIAWTELPTYKNLTIKPSY